MLNREEKRIIGLTTSAHALVHLFEGAIPPLIPLLMTEFATDYFHMGLIVTVFSYAFGLGSLPAGFLSDRLGPRRLVTAFLFGAGAFSVLVLGAGSFLPYALLMGFVGLFCSPYHPASNALIAQNIREKGWAFGIHGIAGSLGVALVPVLSAMVGTAMGWRAPHVLFGAFGLLLGAYSLSIRVQPISRETTGDRQDVPQSEQTISIVNLLVFFFSAMSLGLSYKGIMTFLPAYMGESVQIGGLALNKVTLGGTITTLALLSGAFGQYYAGAMVDRVRAEKLYIWAIGIGAISVFVMSVSTNLLLIGASMVYALFYFATQPIQNYLISRYFPRHRQGMGFGIHFCITFGIGSTSAAISGYLADHYGLASVFYFMGGCFLMSFVAATVLLIRTSGNEAAARATR